LGRFQIEGDAALVAIGAHMHHALPLVPDIPAAPVPLPSPLGALDCNDVGAEVSERLDAHGAEQEMVEARPLHRATPRSFCSMSPCQIWTRSCAQMRLELKELRLRVPTTSIFVTHDQTEAMTLGDRIVVMKDGVMQQVARRSSSTASRPTASWRASSAHP